MFPSNNNKNRSRIVPLPEESRSSDKDTHTTPTSNEVNVISNVGVVDAKRGVDQHLGSEELLPVSLQLNCEDQHTTVGYTSATSFLKK